MSKKISAEDSALFRQNIGKVQPIKHNIKSPYKKIKKPYTKPQTLVTTDNFEQYLTIKIPSPEDNICFLETRLQKDVLKKLRQGYFGIDYTIYLHGLTKHEAHSKLARCLTIKATDNYRCVRIIHGKGLHSINKQPILKQYINIWLRKHKNVCAFCSAPPKYGSTGAVLVLLANQEI